MSFLRPNSKGPLALAMALSLLLGFGLARGLQATDDLRVLRRIWPHTLIVKGILHPQDALLAADCGADSVIVSNHGGRGDP